MHDSGRLVVTKLSDTWASALLLSQEQGARVTWVITVMLSLMKTRSEWDWT